MLRWIPFVLFTLACQPKAPDLGDDETRGDAGVFTDETDTGLTDDDTGPTGSDDGDDTAPTDDTGVTDDTGPTGTPGTDDTSGTDDTGAADPDSDGDGFAASDDCDDDDATVFPGADEYCDGVDQDCDDTIDEESVGPGTWYLDDDGDGYGDMGVTIETCEPPDGYVDNADDCNDEEVSHNPDGTEVCGGGDEDCDGVTDEGGATDAELWYADGDEDGYGDPASALSACELPEGYTDDNTDCGPGESSIYPGADEYCDGADNDCDSAVDEDALEDAVWYQDNDGDGYGTNDATVEACEQPEGYALNADDCDDSVETGAGVYPGAAEACNDVDDDCNGSIDDDAFDAESWFLDFDGDEYGTADAELLACSQPEGYVAVSAGRYDCDDGAADVYPGAEEQCNERDDDCDGIIDNDAPLPGRWFADADEDGYGDPDDNVNACEQPDGYIADDSDCDDGDADIYPGALEVCDGVNQDCDLSVDEDGADATNWHRDYDEDGYGDPDATREACDAPEGYTDDGTDCDDVNPNTYPGADEYCDGNDSNCDGFGDDGALDANTWHLDADEDGYGDPGVTQEICIRPNGYVTDGTDCDDADGTTYPGATEQCDNGDDDCDTLVDEDAVGLGTWYADDDDDGWGDPSDSQTTCVQPDGYVSNDGDCAPGDSDVFPGAEEICNDDDDDCDSAVDEDAIDQGSYYADDDSDGYGDPSDAVRACDEPSGYSSNNDDCDDSDGGVYPTADEYCNDGDDDCDDSVDEDPVDATTYYRDRDQDGFGDDSASADSCDTPSGDGYATEGGDCDDDDDDINPDATEECDGVDEDCDGVIDSQDACDSCTIDWYDGHAYLFCAYDVSWYSAEYYCDFGEYNLVSIESPDENAYLTDVIDDFVAADYTSYWWIGYTDQGSEGDFYWWDGSSGTYENWESGEPNNSGNEDCVELGRFDDGRWNDNQCWNDDNYFLCEAG